MRYRKLTATGDYAFGHGLADFYIDQPEAVGQAAETRFQLWRGDWFLDRSKGVPYRTKILGKYTGSTRDPVIQQTILETQGCNELLSYSSSFDPQTRKFTVNATADTIYGQTQIPVPK